MTRINGMLRDVPEIIVQYSTYMIYSLDPVFQQRRILERNWQSVSESDHIDLRTVAAAAAGVSLMLVLFCLVGFGGTLLTVLNWHLLIFQNFGIGYPLVLLSVCILVLYKLWQYREMIFPVTGIGVSTEGLSIYHGNISIGVNKHFPWQTITDISVTRGNTNKKKGRKEAFIQIRTLKGKTAKLAINAIRSIEERKLLVDAFKIHARRAINAREIDQMIRISDTQDIPFTQLWSQALRSSLPRNASSVLPISTLLQDGRYMIKEQIGGGGQGAVYLSEMLDLADQKTDVALKEYVLPNQEHLFDRKRAVEQFEREVHLLARLKHKNLAELIDAFVEDHRAYLVIEYLKGKSLRQLIKSSGTLSPDFCCQIALQLCDVLHYLHSFEPPVVHLDVSPENIIVMADNTIKLIDFNTSSDGSGLRTKLIAGKQHYMPPEQYRNEISPQCDIYSFGCTLFFMLTGIEPEPLTVLHPSQYVSMLNPLWEEIVSEATNLDLSTRSKNIETVRSKIITLSRKAESGRE